MARNTSHVLLGYEDEHVTDKNKHFIDFTTSKVGGQPNWPSTEIPVPGCPICGLRRPLILQVYAPLDKSPFHRTLYVFSCVNAVCSNQSNGWICLRVQEMETISNNGRPQAAPAVANVNWCSGADDWGDSGDTMSNASSAAAIAESFDEDRDNANDEPNGNVISKMDNRMSDEDEETNSLENDPIPAFENLVVDDRNANGGAQGGAVGRLNSPSATAEIEGEESELVTIDVPVAPKRDLIALLQRTNAVPVDQAKIHLRSFFIYVDSEKRSSTCAMADHVRQLLQEYQGAQDKISPTSPGSGAVGGSESFSSGSTEEYEKGIPIHGDVMFHNFLLNLQENPGQIIRYSRDALPLLIAPLAEPKQSCQNCGAELICEVQILPTLIPKLRFSSTGDAAPIEFGNVLILTCQRSCWDTPDKMRVEHIIVQAEN